MSGPYVWFETRELRRRRTQRLARVAFYLLTAVVAAIVVMELAR